MKKRTRHQPEPYRELDEQFVKTLEGMSHTIKLIHDRVAKIERYLNDEHTRRTLKSAGKRPEPKETQGKKIL